MVTTVFIRLTAGRKELRVKSLKEVEYTYSSADWVVENTGESLADTAYSPL